MSSNKSENYSIALNLREDEIYLDINDEDLNVFKGENTDFIVGFVKKNTISIEIPEDINPVDLSKHPMWDEYDARCIACGRCDDACPQYISFSECIDKVNDAVKEEGK